MVAPLALMQPGYTLSPLLPKLIVVEPKPDRYPMRLTHVVPAIAIDQNPCSAGVFFDR